MIPSFKTLLTTLCLCCLMAATILFCVLHTKTRWIPAKRDGRPTFSYRVLNAVRKQSFNPKAAGGTLPGSGRSPSNTDDVSSCFPEGSTRGLKNSACVCKKGWHGRDCAIPDAVWFTEEFRAWYAEGLIRRRSRPRRIINGLVFNHELDLLEIRIKELGDAVDHYLVVESPYTYFGTEKPLHLRNNLSAGFLPEHKHKIVPISVDFFNYNGGDPWGPENYFRTSVWWEGHRRLKDIRDDDIFIMSDADEIPSREVVLFLRHHDGFGEPVMLRLRWFAYGFFWENNTPVDVSGACTVAYIRNVYGNDSLRLRAMRTFAANNMPKAGTFSEKWTVTGTPPRYAGWHCSWCFDVRGIQVKLAAAQRDDGVRWGDIAEKSDSGYINSLRKKGMYFDGSAGLIRRDPNRTAPTYVRENAERFTCLMRP